MDERRQFVARRIVGEPMAKLCRDFAISGQTVHKIFDRHQASAAALPIPEPAGRLPPCRHVTRHGGRGAHRRKAQLSTGRSKAKALHRPRLRFIPGSRSPKVPRRRLASE